MKTQLPEKLMNGGNACHIREQGSNDFIGECDHPKIALEVVSRYNAHSQLVKERDELAKTLKECEMQLAIYHPNSDKDSGPIKSARDAARVVLAKLKEEQ